MASDDEITHKHFTTLANVNISSGARSLINFHKQAGKKYLRGMNRAGTETYILTLRHTISRVPTDSLRLET